MNEWIASAIANERANEWMNENIPDIFFYQMQTPNMF